MPPFDVRPDNGIVGVAGGSGLDEPLALPTELLLLEGTPAEATP